MTTPYTVQRGDNLSKIARAHRLSNWRDIYDHAENADFRRRRPNPNLIHPGDVVMIPDPSPDESALPEADAPADEAEHDDQTELHLDGQEFEEPLPPTQPTVPSDDETVAKVLPAPPLPESERAQRVAQRRNVIYISREHV